MKKTTLTAYCNSFLTIALLFTAIIFTACAGGGGGQNESNNSEYTQAYDFEKLGMPVIIENHYIDYSKLLYISKFRSAWGHDYSDSFEHCRSMKHYFQMPNTVEGLSIYSPVTGVIVAKFDEQTAGAQYWIRPTSAQYATVKIFHINGALNIGDSINAGQSIGTHATSSTASDICIELNTTTGKKLVSYFDVMPDNLFANMASFGITNRSQLIITKEQRDADPLSCSGESFQNQGTIENIYFLPSAP